MFKKLKKSNSAYYISQKVNQSNLVRNTVSFFFSPKLQGRLIPQTYTGSNQDYQKFIIMSQGRSGSTMLRGILAQHSQIISFGEIFRDRRISFNIEGYNNESKSLLLLRNWYPTYFLDHFIFPAYSENIKAVGFKVFAHHLNHPRFAPVWEWLNCNKDIKVIFLIRKNFLASITSAEKARKTGIWGITDNSSRDKLNVTLDYENLVMRFKNRHRSNAEALNRLSNHQILQITYEEIIGDYNNKIRNIQNFLGVDFELHKPIGKKQEVRPLSEVITNYNELRGRFINTEWSSFFES
jgi:LPS sulfotransferase NodH